MTQKLNESDKITLLAYDEIIGGCSICPQEMQVCDIQDGHNACFGVIYQGKYGVVETTNKDGEYFFKETTKSEAENFACI